MDQQFEGDFQIPEFEHNAGSQAFSLPEPEVVTGRKILLLQRDAQDKAIKELGNAVGVSVSARSRDYGSHGIRMADLNPGEGVLLERLGVAMIAPDPDQRLALASSNELPGVLAIEDERYVYVAEEFRDVYVRGYRDGVANLAASLLDTPKVKQGDAVSSTAHLWADTEDATWGIQAIGASMCPYLGRGNRVAVLDTGLDKSHPEVGGIAIAEESFVAGEDVQDVNGHGTHCIGILAGPRLRSGLNYGVAPEAEVLVGKVLNPRGRGVDLDVIAAIEWALTQGARIVSMSLSGRTSPGEHFNAVFEGVARRSMEEGAVLVAAAGNDSHRVRGRIAPVGHPANCPSVLAVAAVDQRESVANFSNGVPSPTAIGGRVAVAAPGVAIRSAWPNGPYRTLDGTSMATPFVAGVLALLAQVRNPTGPDEMIRDLMSSCRPIGHPDDVGAGLVQVGG